MSSPARAQPTTTADEVTAFEIGTRDLVGLALRSVDRVEVSLPQYRLLLVLHELGRSTSGACARALGVAGSSVTRLADRLDASGHLRRGDDPSNRSIVTLELTDSGRRVVTKVRAHRRKELRQLLDGLEPAERAACAGALRTLHQLAGGDRGDDLSSPMPL